MGVLWSRGQREEPGNVCVCGKTMSEEQVSLNSAGALHGVSKECVSVPPLHWLTVSVWQTRAKHTPLSVHTHTTASRRTYTDLPQCTSIAKCQSHPNQRSELEETQDYCFSITTSARHGEDAEGTCMGKAVKGNRYKPTDPWIIPEWWDCYPNPSISSKDHALKTLSHLNRHDFDVKDV